MRARFLAIAITSVLAAGSLQLTADAETDSPLDSRTSPLAAKVGKLWQTDGVVWALAYSNGVLYAGGSFDAVRPPGAAPGSDEEPQPRIAAFNAENGKFIKQWRPDISGGDVFALNVSPAGDRLYAGGTFDEVDGADHDNLAAFDISNPKLPELLPRPDFAAGVDGKVTDIDSSATTVWAGGEFAHANGEPRSRVAAFSALDGSLTPFDVSISGATAPWYSSPFVTAVEQSAGKLYIGGMFSQVNGSPQNAFAVVNSVTGGTDPLFSVPDIKETSYVTDAQVENGQVYVVGRDDHSSDHDRLEGLMAMNALTGTVLFGGDQHRCLGDSFALESVQRKMWVATHAHSCSQVGTYSESRPRFYAAVLSHDPLTGEQAGFYPEVSGSSRVHGSMNNMRALATDGTNLYAAGGFLTVEGVQQQNLVRFTPPPDSVSPVRVARPTAEVTGSNDVRVSWTTSSDPDDRVLDYDVLRNNGNQAVATVSEDSPFWNRHTVTFTDDTVGAGEEVYYRIRVHDGENGVTSARSNSVTTNGGSDDHSGTCCRSPGADAEHACVRR